MTHLTHKKCHPCEASTPPLEGMELCDFATKLGGGWKVINDHHLEKEYNFKDFNEALAFTNQLGKLAEEEGHHPDIHVSWGKVRVLIWTHKINGLSENDFILAAKCDALIIKTAQS